MPLTQTRHQLDILQLPGTPDTLLLQDLSQYRDFADYPRLSLTKPGSTQVLNLPFSPGDTNVYHRSKTGGLPDGLYTATYSVTPHDQAFVCYQFFRTETISCELTGWLTQIDWEYEPVDSTAYQTLAKVTALLMGARAEAGHNNQKANQYYLLAKKLLTNVTKSTKEFAGYRH